MGVSREALYLPYKGTYAFTKDLFNDPAKVAQANRILEKNGKDWRIDETFLNEVREHASGDWAGVYKHAPVTGLTRGEQLRANRTAQERLEKAEEIARPIGDQERPTPLSNREILAQSSELPRLAGSRLEEKVRWQPGASWFRAKTVDEVTEANAPQTHPYLQGVAALRAPQVAGVSGTTDNLLTLACALGLSSPEERLNARLALLGWMVSEKDHSVHEIMTASQAFGLPYEAGPTDYESILPADPSFLDRVRAEQDRRGYRMPDEYLKES